jgi:ligand-binding SRPBCC domain-containing protein
LPSHILKRSQVIELPRDKVFDFFADAANLEAITPPELRFSILTPQPIDIRRGTLIDYRLRLYGIPIRWRTEITDWDPPYSFVDRQIRGPYAEWVHTHSFEAADDKTTVMSDEVRYRLPLGMLSDLGHFIVRRQLERIFGFRAEAIEQMLLRDR